jgi:hypothetical protein
LPLRAGQHGSLGPPHPEQVLLWQEVKGAVHATVLPQQGMPGPPHVPHAPFWHVPAPPPHVLPLPAQVCVA